MESTHIGVFNLKGLHPQLKEFGSSSKLPNKLFKEITQRLQKGKVLGLKNIILATFCSLEVCLSWMPNLVSYVMELYASCGSSN